eukprot:CAMPEP_0170488858 /NCGR_PEP_ID=MMETSP0208-20121228/7308_1 /TAXON_ID=197538 /ORGANISM="Strombidium inclinatum, Strain S3" /LENGTH=152 /DNA_ID=CAMNT_0010763559 /DNA_START=54 /DNA_END=512 /DNA_ORIENTATION=+
MTHRKLVPVLTNPEILKVPESLKTQYLQLQREAPHAMTPQVKRNSSRGSELSLLKSEGEWDYQKSLNQKPILHMRTALESALEYGLAPKSKRNGHPSKLAPLNTQPCLSRVIQQPKESKARPPMLPRISIKAKTFRKKQDNLTADVDLIEST